MSEGFIEVAVWGPPLGTYTYCAKPEVADKLQPGQRLLVPFGQARKVGFYLGSTSAPPGVRIRPVSERLDEVSYIDAELLKFCLWLADYYFANPADCLAAALPPALRGRHPVALTWARDAESVPEDVTPWLRRGKRLNPQVVRHLSRRPGGLASLLSAGIVRESWPQPAEPRRTISYRAVVSDGWSDAFSRSRFQPEPFEGLRSRKELLAEGWSEYQIKKGRDTGLLEVVESERTESALPFIPGREGVREIDLTPSQKSVLAALRESLEGGFCPTLLHGVTGSGKTLVYCHLGAELLGRRRTVLVLTPEIALSGATLAYFRGFFGSEATVWHSAMTARERLESWRGIREGRYRIVVGPRSALFAPLPDLGLIIVDEEHDPSYKQDNPAPRFQGRDAAVMRAKLAGIPVLLGSASPSIESYHQARSGRYRLLELTERPPGARLPEVRTIDMCRQRLGEPTPFMSYPLKQAVQDHLAAGQQAILFLNRRGHSPQLRCGECGHVAVCPSCDVRLVYHSAGGYLSCHYCGHVEQAYAACPKCGSGELLRLGIGTQKVEELLPRILPDARIVRFDSDSAGGRVRSHRILDAFGRGEHNVLLGTQMVTKGLDFARVTLVGVLAADMAIDLPDFRSGERAFARLLQVAGRSGRAAVPGQVLIQTYSPEHPLFADVVAQDYAAFYEREIEHRRTLNYPPFARLIRFVFSGKDEAALRSESQGFRRRLVDWLGEAALDVLGPAPCPLEFVRGRHRRHLLVKTRQTVASVRKLRAWYESDRRFGLPAAIDLTIDVDPDDMM